MIKKADFL